MSWLLVPLLGAAAQAAHCPGLCYLAVHALGVPLFAAVVALIRRCGAAPHETAFDGTNYLPAAVQEKHFGMVQVRVFFFLREEMHLRIQLPRGSWYVGLRGARRDYPLKPHGGRSMMMYDPLYLRGGMSNASQRTSVSLRGMLGHVPGTRDRRASDGLRHR
jgi:hypothetical protein